LIIIFPKLPLFTLHVFLIAFNSFLKVGVIIEGKHGKSI
jgi:hypothetical protein